MRALRLHGSGDLRLHDEPDPQPADGEVLLAVTAVGLCGSDRHWFADGGIGDAAVQRPLVLGHEWVGVLRSGPRAGERVALEPAISCGHCTLCLAGHPHLCLNIRFAGHNPTDGALRDVMTWPEHLAYPLPDGVSDAQGTLLEPLGVAIHALDLGHARPGMTAGVFGCGPIGLLLVRLLVMVGCNVIATEPLDHRRAAAAEMGADVVLHGGGDVQPGSVDVAFETAGNDDAITDALVALRPAGRVVLVGIPDGDRSSFPAATARRKGATIMLSRRMAVHDLPRAIALVRSGRISLDGLVTETHPLEDAGEAFAGLTAQRGLKIVVAP